MRKICVVCVLAVLVSLVACSGAENTGSSVSVNDEVVGMSVNGVAEVITVHGDRMVYDSLSMLLEPTLFSYNDVEWTEDFSADLIVVGEFIEESAMRFEYEYSPVFEKEIVNNASAYNKLLITEVLKGDVKVGDVVTVKQRYAFDEERGALISFSDLTPMHKGDRWIYFLRRSQIETDVFVSAGDSDGRYPLPTQELRQATNEYSSEMSRLSECVGDGCTGDCGLVRERAISEVDVSMLGVLNPLDFKFNVYAEILDYFKFDNQDDWANPGRSFDRRLVEIANR